jgi:hypothetical protein
MPTSKINMLLILKVKHNLRELQYFVPESIQLLLNPKNTFDYQWSPPGSLMLATLPNVSGK